MKKKNKKNGLGFIDKNKKNGLGFIDETKNSL
jgi:hypothetical protein